MSRPIPRLFLIRHGETEWSINGRHTGLTDIPLTPRGEAQIREKAKVIVGDGLLVDPKNFGMVLISPRQRAHRTFHLMFEHLGQFPSHVITPEIQEWDYGRYEGMTSQEIKQQNTNWSIWTDGCPEGEAPEEIQSRVDNVIMKIRELHRKYCKGDVDTRDVMVVAHGHFNRVFIARWLAMPVRYGTFFNIEPGSVAILGYDHYSLEEPVINGLNLYANAI